MEKLKGHNFKLQKGDYIILRKKSVTFENMVKSYIGVVRDYDGVNSKSGCLSKSYIIYHISGEIREIAIQEVFAWYKDSFFILRDMETKGISPLKDDGVDLYKMDEKEIEKFKGKITKNKILMGLKKRG